MAQSSQRTSAPFVRINERQSKPRTHGVTEIRGAILRAMGNTICKNSGDDGRHTSIASNSPAAPCAHARAPVVELISLCHDHDVLVSTGGFIEHVLTQGPEAVDRYIQECRELGFDIIEISSGFISIAHG